MRFPAKLPGFDLPVEFLIHYRLPIVCVTHNSLRELCYTVVCVARNSLRESRGVRGDEALDSYRVLVRLEESGIDGVFLGYEKSCEEGLPNGWVRRLAHGDKTLGELLGLLELLEMPLGLLLEQLTYRELVVNIPTSGEDGYMFAETREPLLEKHNLLLKNDFEIGLHESKRVY